MESSLSYAPKLERLESVRGMQVLETVARVATARGQEAYDIGGFVRDTILGREVKDIDIVCLGSGIDLAQAVAKAMGGLQVHVFKRFGTAMIKQG